MPKFSVTYPIVGEVTVTVEAATAEEAIELVGGGEGDIDDNALTWEYEELGGFLDKHAHAELVEDEKPKRRRRKKASS